MVAPNREPANTYNFSLNQPPTNTQTPLSISTSMDIEDHQLRGCSFSPGINNHLRSQSVNSALTTSSMDYTERMETQHTGRSWADQLEQEEQAPPSL